MLEPKEDHQPGAVMSSCPLRILLAEDNAVNQKVAQRMIERLGYRADIAANGLEVLEALERQAYDLILMDVQMPELDGLECTRQIRARTGAGQLRIVAMTAFAFRADLEKCLAAGMDAFITKPIRIEALAAVLGQYRDETRITRKPEEHEILQQEGEAMGAEGSSQPQIDQARWDDLASSLGEQMGEIVETYLADTPARIAEMRTALQADDLEGVERLAHSIKSSSGIFGAQTMAALCKQLEFAARDRQQDVIEQIESVQQAFDELEKELLEKRSSL
jgi:CheY-like chemotaxis protein